MLLTQRQFFPNIESYNTIKTEPKGTSEVSDHAIAVASRIVSGPVASCQKVNIVWLQGGDWADTIDALKRVHDHIKKKDKLLFGKNRKGKAYIIMSFDFPDPPKNQNQINSLKEAANSVTKLDALIIIAAGNGGGPIRKWPALLGETNNRVVVVGSTWIDGSPAGFSNTASWVKIHAVGVKSAVIGLNEQRNWVLKEYDGTSFSKSIS